jgi:hypothetical protein
MTSENALATMPDPLTNTVLVPQREVAGRLTPLHVVNWTTLTLDVATETYPITGGGRGLHKSALNKVASAAGMRVVSSKPMTDPRDPDYLLWQVEVEMDMGGELPIRAIGTKEWKKGVGKDGGDNEHRTSKTETKALLRAVRALLGVKTKYDEAELARPIAVPHIVYSPDLSDPNVAEFAARKALGAASTLGFGENVDTTTGEVLVGEVIDIDEDEPPLVIDAGPMPDFTAEAADDDTASRQRTLQGTVYQSNGSGFDGMTFADIFTHAEGGARWFDKVEEWGKANASTLNEPQKQLIIAVVEFRALLKANGGELL